MRGVEVDDAQQHPVSEEQILRDQIAVDDGHRQL
jgi:hypothetical protein